LSAFVSELLRLLGAIGSSLGRTLDELVGALRSRSKSGVVALVSEGSPLESLLDSVLALVFWVLLLAPLLVLPAVYFFISFLR
jgi:hypothetical protein